MPILKRVEKKKKKKSHALWVVEFGQRMHLKWECIVSPKSRRLKVSL
jgi:hypothetical protein